MIDQTPNLTNTRIPEYDRNLQSLHRHISTSSAFGQNMACNRVAGGLDYANPLHSHPASSLDPSVYPPTHSIGMTNAPLDNYQYGSASELPLNMQKYSSMTVGSNTQEDMPYFEGNLPSLANNSLTATTFACKICGKALVKQYVFVKRRSHLGLTVIYLKSKPRCPYEALVRSPIQEFSLIPSKLVHDPDRKFGCELCPSRFLRRYDLELVISCMLGCSKPDLDPQSTLTNAYKGAPLCM